MGKKRRYSDDDRANALAALAANGGNVRRTSRQLGIPAVTLRSWRDGERAAIPSESVDSKKKALSEQLEGIARQLLDRLTVEKIDDCSLRELMTAVGIAVDKMLLLRGQATVITDNTNRPDDSSPDEVRARVDELLAKRQSRDGTDASPGTGTANCQRREAA